jgi:hypothetical protein
MDTRPSQLSFRPRFKKQVMLPAEEVKSRLIEALKVSEHICKGNIVDNHVMLRIPKNQQQYWSPQLHLELEDNVDGTLIRGLFGPKPGVWTMFVFFYSAIGFLTMLGLIFGLSQMMLKMNAFGLWIVPVGSILLIGLFLISKFGQKLGFEQMQQLKLFVDKALE